RVSAPDVRLARLSRQRQLPGHAALLRSSRERDLRLDRDGLPPEPADPAPARSSSSAASSRYKGLAGYGKQVVEEAVGVADNGNSGRASPVHHRDALLRPSTESSAGYKPHALSQI